MSSGVPPSPPVTSRWSTPRALAAARTRRSGRVSSGTAALSDDPHAERLEPAREPRGVRVLGVARDELVPDRQDGCEHMASMQIRDTDPEADADQVVELLLVTNPTIVTNAAAWLHRYRSVPERARLRSVGRRGRRADRGRPRRPLRQLLRTAAARRVPAPAGAPGPAAAGASAARCYDVGAAHAARDRRRSSCCVDVRRDRGRGRVRDPARLARGASRDASRRSTRAR